MNINEVMEKAGVMAINTSGMNKAEMIRSIQRTEDKIRCYGTDWVDYCDRAQCLWKYDCSRTEVQQNEL